MCRTDGAVLSVHAATYTGNLGELQTAVTETERATAAIQDK